MISWITGYNYFINNMKLWQLKTKYWPLIIWTNKQTNKQSQRYFCLNKYIIYTLRKFPRITFTISIIDLRCQFFPRFDKTSLSPFSQITKLSDYSELTLMKLVILQKQFEFSYNFAMVICIILRKCKESILCNFVHSIWKKL